VTLTIHKEEDEQRQLNVAVEVDEQRVLDQMRRTARKLARDIRVPGFRRGKVPYQVLVRRVGEEALRAEAVEEMLESVLEEALQEVGADEIAYRQPSLEDMQFEPLQLKITIPLEPIIKLGDYRSVRRDLEEIKVTDEALAEAMENLRAQQQILEEVDRPAELGDLVTVSGEAKREDEDGEERVIWHEHGVDLVMDVEKTFSDVDFVVNIVGLSAGDEKEFEVTFPEDMEDEELAGKSAVFNVTVEKVQSRELPEMNDELAQEVGDYETVADLEEGLRSELLAQAEEQAKNELMDEMVEGMLAKAELHYPPTLVKSELDNTLESFKGQVTNSGIKWEDYLTLQSETEESLREGWHDDAVKQVERGLVLREFVEKEKIKVKQVDIDTALDKRLERFGDNDELKEQLRSIFLQGQNLESMTSEILFNKAHDRVREIVSGNAPDLEALELEEEEAKASMEEEE
jgi:trigger factor